MRRVRKQTERAEFTWHKPPRLKWRIKFFASICLFAFMGGLMLGKLVREPADGRVRLVEQQPLPDGLRLCFDGAVGVAEVRGQGLYGLYLQGLHGAEQAGVLPLVTGQQVRWSLQAGDGHMQLQFVALQPLQGRWQVEDERCLRVSLALQSG